MWVPVLEAERLGQRPARVLYWGSPVVLFRLRNGRVAALADRCAHRGVRLSHGVVQDDTIRCDYHHFRYDAEGNCTEVPEEFRATRAYQERCRITRYFTREAVGLIWISVEDEPSAPFPVTGASLPEPHTYAAGHFAVRGDVRVWMDHFLDIPHCIWTHAETAYWGRRRRPAELTSHRIHIGPADDYPVRPAIDMEFLARHQAPVTYDWKMGLVSGCQQIMSLVRRRSTSAEPFHLRVRADLVSPLCQESHIELGRTGQRLVGWTSLNPVSEDRIDFYWAAVWQPRGRGPLRGVAPARLIGDFARQHLAVEDGRVLDDAEYVEGDAFNDTALDSTVRSMRAVFARYQKDKAHLYPVGSLMRSLDYQDTEWAARHEERQRRQP